MIDSNAIFFLTGKFFIGILLFIRLLGMFAAGPFFRSEAIMPQVKIFLGVIIAASLTTAFWKEQPQIDFHLWYIVLVVFKEIFVGVAIGMAANVVFYAARLAGGMIDFNMSYNTASLFSEEDSSPTLVGEFFNLMTLMLFLFLNGHHFLIESVYISIRAVPITVFEVTGSSVEILTRLAITIFVLGVKMSAPILVAIFLTNVALALLSRIAPQTNIFILSFQMKISVGLIILFLSVPFFAVVAKQALHAMESETLKFLLSLNPARV